MVTCSIILYSLKVIGTIKAVPFALLYKIMEYSESTKILRKGYRLYGSNQGTKNTHLSG